MHSANRFQLSLVLSALLHLAVLIPLAALDIMPKQRTLNELEVNYFKIPSKDTILVKKIFKDKQEEDLEKIGLRQRIVLSDEDRIPEKNIRAGDKVRGEDISAKIKYALQKPSLPGVELLPRNDIRFSLTDSSKSQSPAYLSYRNFLHENIRRYLYDKYSDSTERGMVYLTFVLNSNGTVKDAQVIDSKSNAGQNLKQIVLDSLYAASPFPPLPEALNSPILTFSVSVHFKEQNIE